MTKPLSKLLTVNRSFPASLLRCPLKQFSQGRFLCSCSLTLPQKFFVIFLEEVVPRGNFSFTARNGSEWASAGVEGSACPRPWSHIVSQGFPLWVTSWIDARSEVLGDKATPWTSWTLVICQAKTPMILRPFPVLKTASHPHGVYSLFFQHKTSCRAHLQPGMAKKQLQPKPSVQGGWVKLLHFPHTFLLQGKWTWLEPPWNIRTRATLMAGGKTRMRRVSGGFTEPSHRISSDLGERETYFRLV